MSELEQHEARVDALWAAEHPGEPKTAPGTSKAALDRILAGERPDVPTEAEIHAEIASGRALARAISKLAADVPDLFGPEVD